MIQRTVTQAKGQLSALVEAALTGEEVVLSRAGKAVIRLVPVERDLRTLEPGRLKGLVLPADFDKTDQEIIDDFENRGLIAQNLALLARHKVGSQWRRMTLQVLVHEDPDRAAPKVVSQS